MKKYFYAIVIFSAILILNISKVSSQPEWTIQNSGTNYDLWTVDFINDYTGFVAGNNGLVLKTTNAGDNWISQHAGYNDLIGVYFINDQTGWVSGHFGSIYKTTNGGVNWINKPSPTNKNLFFVQFVNANTGFISSDGGVLKSTDGGETWGFSFMSGIPVYRMYFINETHGWFGDNLGNQFLSSNNGVHWLYTQNVPGAGNVGFKFINQWTGWAVGYNNTIIKTTDGGYNWFNQFDGLPLGTQLRGVEFQDNSESNGWIVGRSNTVLRTSNGGDNWISTPTPVNGEFTSVKFINARTGWIVGFSGVILKTTSGDLTGMNPVSNYKADDFNLSQNYPNPFNPSTNIRFDIPVSGFVSLIVYDITGKQVAELIKDEITKGTYEVKFDASQLPSGAYFYKLNAGGFVSTKMMTLIK